MTVHQDLYVEVPRADTPAESARATWSVRLEKEYFKFSAAHFLIFEDGTAERLHGHNYRVGVELTARRTSHGMVLDFQELKPRIRELVDRLDEHFLVPGKHPDLEYAIESDGNLEIRHGKHRYVMPVMDAIILPITNTSSENLAGWLAENLARDLFRRYPELQMTELHVRVEETDGQSGIVTLEFPK